MPLPISTIISNHLVAIDRIITPVDAGHAALTTQLVALAERLALIRQTDGRVYVCGNGGSASNAGHLVLHLRDVHIRAFDLIADIPWLTATANDYAYDQVFSMALHALGAGPNDLLIAISGSGNSKNIIVALEHAKKKAVASWGLFGMGGGKAAALCDNQVLVESDSYPVIEDIHSICIHALDRVLR